MAYRLLIIIAILLLLVVSNTQAFDRYVSVSYGRLIRTIPLLPGEVFLEGTPEQKWDTYGLGVALSFSHWAPEVDIEFFLSPKKGSYQQVGGLAGIRQRIAGPLLGTLGVGMISESGDGSIYGYWVNANTGEFIDWARKGGMDELAYVLTYGINIEPIRKFRVGAKLIEVLSGDTAYAESFELVRFYLELKI